MRPPTPPEQDTDIVDVTVIGGGPAGLVCAFEAGLREASARVIESLPQLGGQLAALYPEKYIYDVPGFPRILARDLVENCVEQGLQFGAAYHVGEVAERLEDVEDPEEPGKPAFRIHTDKGNAYLSRKVVVAAGNGAFEPRRPEVPDLASFEERGEVRYAVLDPADFAGKRVLIAGGGDSALDWALRLPEEGAKVALVHRTNKFRAIERSMSRLRALVDEEVITLHEWSRLAELRRDAAGRLATAVLTSTRKGEDAAFEQPCDVVLPLLGFHAALGPIERWGLQIEHGQIVVDWSTGLQTSRYGVFAVGDVNVYPGKLKLIATGFGEAPHAVNHALHQIRPDMKLQPKHSTTSMPSSSTVAHPEDANPFATA
jgi:thioredoxin reductase (NADPH)